MKSCNEIRKVATAFSKHRRNTCGYKDLSRPVSRNADTFGYNARGEIVISRRGAESAKDSYAYDNIGNLQISAFNYITNLYTANNLNQYTTILRTSASPREIVHDADGNIFSDGILSFTYDAANRLKTVSSNGVLLVTNYYDAKSRRVKKVTPEATFTFFYDGWNLIEERVASTNGISTTIHYYWGKDLSGTLQGAGGVGGLLYLTLDGAIYLPAYDSNGNIVCYLDANGNIVAQYTYDAFGKTIAQSGILAAVFRHRFSTKYYDVETGLYYYGYRFYPPSNHRWMNRDPIEEEGGNNLYCFCGNNPFSFIDSLGEKISIREEVIVKDVIGRQSRAFFRQHANVFFTCSWSGVLNINGSASRRIEIITPGQPQWKARHDVYNQNWGVNRTDATEWQAAYAHEMDHWNSFNAFFAFLHMLNEFDGKKFCHLCNEVKKDLERQYNVMRGAAMQHSAKYDTDGFKGGGMYPKAK